MKEFSIAKRAAREAGKILMAHLGKLRDVRYKSRRDPVSEADKASEACIAGIIKEAFPAHGFLAEENTAWGGRADGVRWIVDPLDGTVNFTHGYPSFCVSIALERGGEVVLGVVYDPVRREMFTALKGQGAHLNGRPISVSKTSRLIRSLLVTGFPYDIDKRPDEILGYFRKMSLAAQGVRRDGSAALDLCYLAMGRFDGYWELGLKPWDTAAGMLIVREAGGRVTNFTGTPFVPEMQEILATNGRVHGEMTELLFKARTFFRTRKKVPKKANNYNPNMGV
jgi:myo-inositol-1(or 4)-monophosphatase